MSVSAHETGTKDTTTVHGPSNAQARAAPMLRRALTGEDRLQMQAMTSRNSSSLLVLLGTLWIAGCSGDDQGSSTSSTGGAGTGAAANAGTGGSTGGSVTGGTNSGGTGGFPTTGGTGGSNVGVGGGMTGGSSSGGSAHASGPSEGCGKPVLGASNEWLQHDIQVSVDPEFTADFGARVYFTRPPENYDPNTPYPLVVWGQGCGQSMSEETPISTGPAADFAVQVELLADSDNHACYSAGPDGDDANSPEVPYFDAVLAEVEQSFCIDKGRVFMGGWSSGGWLSALLACTRTDVIKGVGWASAGLQLNHPTCMGAMPAVVVRGVDDGGTPLEQTLDAVESLRVRNGCSMETQPWRPGETAFDTNDCVQYQGCMPGSPLVWCAIPGGHTNGGALSSVGFWQFWSELP